MQKHMLIAMLTASAAVSAFSVAPCAAASVTESSVYYQPPSASATRQPRTGSAGRLVTIAGSQFTLDPNISAATVSVPTNPNPNISVGTATYALAYVNVSGGAGGGITVFPGANTDFVTVPVQSPAQNIVVQNVYFQTGGGGPPCPPNTVCSTGADIDEFSETLGTLLDDTFVNVFTPPTSTAANASLTTTANVDGTVTTTDAGVRIGALNPPMPYQNNPTGGTFDKWTTGPGGTIGPTPQDLVVNKQTSDYALALYRSACPAGYYWNPSATISQCSANPTCPANEVWNATARQCQKIASGCPRTCAFGCYLPYISPTGQEIWNCKPAPGSCTPQLESAGCAANQVCTVPGNIDICSCLQCSAK